MRVLLTNDDGIHAPGLAALEDCIRDLADVIVFAPSVERSGCSHSATTAAAIRLTEVDEHRYAVEGTPADCVRIALHRYPDAIDWVLAGINNGGNLGVDVYLSGTVAAVREAALRGLPGLAVSNYRNRELDHSDWARAIRMAKPLIHELMQRDSKPGEFWNVNLPIIDAEGIAPPVVFCDLDYSPLPLSFIEQDGGWRYNGRYAQRQRESGKDVDVCFSGNIAVTLLRTTGFSLPTK